eukprot:TRINITY_DN24012_c0_g1_i1.p1 TRINITY_DN24012_c0_g1~~TRINITY_DN24012_c0_g1_i1.p1  ORF type:complete len:613 (+),score=206.37 TRINITY_DN24012_c0_g1_i1:42-1880(+)
MKTKGTGRGTKKAKGEKQKTSFKRAYLTKAQAARRLQVTNAEFERLVILKGIYPREPKRFDGSSGKDKTYYFTKDVLWLDREPMLQKMREFSTYKKKLTRLKGRRATFDAAAFEKTHKPELQHSLSTIIKERYPTFLDALRDCDDALTHIFLYASLPPRVASDSTIEGHTFLTSAMSDQCKEVRDRWLKYVSSMKNVKKAFISIKGIYYQATVKGESITWQCPYEFTSKPPKDVVYRVLISFLEFYLQQMRFILFKLEHDQKVEAERQELEENDGEEAENFPVSEQEQELAAKHKRHSELLKGLVFCVSREVPKMHIKFIVESFGGVVVDAMKKGVTHCVMDRPKLPPGETKQVGVDYVQPQWLFDCVNAKGLLPVEEYLLGKNLPSHVSPFRISIADDAEENEELEHAVAADRRIQDKDIPDRVHEIRRMLDPSYNKATHTADVHLSDDDEDDEAVQDEADADDSSFEEDEESSFDPDEHVKEEIKRTSASKKRLQKQLATGDNKPSEEAVVAKKRAKLASKKAEKSGLDVNDRKKRKLEEMAAKEEADKEFKEAVMPTKARKLYKAMKFGINKRKKELNEIEDRREMIRTGEAKFDSKSRTLKISKKSKK